MQEITLPLDLRERPSKAALRQRNHCLSCGSQKLTSLWQGSFDDPDVRQDVLRAHYSGEPLAHLQGLCFERVGCEECGLSFQRDILTDEWLKVLYGQWISAEQIAFKDAQQRRRPIEKSRALIQHCLQLHQLLEGDGQRPLRILDFGCGDGKFLQLANAMGFRATGIDFSDSRQLRVRTVGGVHLYSSLAEMEAVASAEETLFDAVTTFQVLEHLADPLATLQALSGHLCPGGVLIVEVPNCQGIEGKPLSEKEFAHIDPLEHINHFTPQSLRQMVQRAGFEAITSPVSFVAGDLKQVAKRAVGGLLRRSPVASWLQSTNLYCRKLG